MHELHKYEGGKNTGKEGYTYRVGGESYGPQSRRDLRFLDVGST